MWGKNNESSSSWMILIGIVRTGILYSMKKKAIAGFEKRNDVIWQALKRSLWLCVETRNRWANAEAERPAGATARTQGRDEGGSYQEGNLGGGGKHLTSGFI